MRLWGDTMVPRTPATMEKRMQSHFGDVRKTLHEKAGEWENLSYQ